MINSISVENFKAFSEVATTKLTDLLVIAGPNSCGKTTFIQALLLLSQTLENPRRDVILDLSGSYVQFAEFRDVVFGKPSNVEARFSIGFELELVEIDLVASLSKEILPESSILDRVRVISSGRRPNSPTSEEAQVKTKAKFKVTFGATRPGKPVVQSLFFEKQATAELTIRHEIERVGKKYRVTVKSISSNKADDGEVANLLGSIAARVTQFGKLAASYSDSKSLRTRTSLKSFFRGMLQLYGLNWDRLPDAFASIKREIEAVKLPLGRTLPKEMALELSGISQMLIELISRLETESTAILPLALDHFLPSTTLSIPGFDPRLDEYLINFIVIFGNVLREIRQYFRTFEYVGPLRAKPERVYLPTGSPPDVGTSGEYAVPILWLEQNEKIQTKTRPGQAPTLKRMEQAVREWFEEFGVAQSLHVTKPKRVIYQAELNGPPGSGTKVTIADVGFGVSQLLPVIVAGLRAPLKSTIIFEQPEIHLHPRLQAKLADFLICLVELGKRVIVETHSEHLINMLRLRIVEDETDDLQRRIGILFIQAFSHQNSNSSETRPKHKGSFVSNLEVNEYGQIVNWPSDFFPEYGDLNERILKAMMVRHTRGNS